MPLAADAAPPLLAAAAAAAAVAALVLLRPLACSRVLPLSKVSMHAVIVSRATITSQGCDAQNSPWARNKRPIIFAAAACSKLVQVSGVDLADTTLLDGPNTLAAGTTAQLRPSAVIKRQGGNPD